MIVVSIVSLFLSFLLQGLVSNFLPYTINSLSIFSTVFVLVNLVILQEYYENHKKFILLIIIFGLLMDIVYNGTMLLSVFIFLVIFYVNKGLKFLLPYNIFTVNLFAFISVIIYHVMTFLFLIILGFDTYSVIVLLKIIGCNILMTVIFASLLYFVISKIVKKFELRVVR